MSDELVCWRCGASLKDLLLPVGRRTTCPACHADLHVCRMCRHYDTTKAKHCREPVAEPVQDKTRANFCDWFQPQPNAYAPPGAMPGTGRTDLAALFGDEAKPGTPGEDAAKKALDDLFG